MSFYGVMSNHFWAVALAFGAINALLLRFRFARLVCEKPEQARGYSLLFWGHLVAMNLPWVVMGIGCTVGGVPTLWFYFRPQDGNPWVLAWWGCTFLLWLLGTYWLFLARGAEMLIKHPDLISGTPSSQGAVKRFWLLCLVGPVGGILVCLLADFPIPPPH